MPSSLDVVKHAIPMTPLLICHPVELFEQAKDPLSSSASVMCSVVMPLLDDLPLTSR